MERWCKITEGTFRFGVKKEPAALLLPSPVTSDNKRWEMSLLGLSFLYPDCMMWGYICIRVASRTGGLCIGAITPHWPTCLPTRRCSWLIPSSNNDCWGPLGELPQYVNYRTGKRGRTLWLYSNRAVRERFASSGECLWSDSFIILVPNVRWRLKATL